MWAKTAAIALILASAVTAQDDDAKKKDDEAKAKIADFKKELKTAKSDKDVVRALEGLGALQHPKVLAEMKSYLSKTSDIAVAAAEQISKYKKDKEAAETLMAATGSRDKETMVKCIRYAGDVEYKGIVPKLVGLFRHKELDAAKESVDSCAKIRSKESIDPSSSCGSSSTGSRRTSRTPAARADSADSAAAASPAPAASARATRKSSSSGSAISPPRWRARSGRSPERTSRTSGPPTTGGARTREPSRIPSSSLYFLPPGGTLLLYYP
jgi:hypothetical protein